MDTLNAILLGILQGLTEFLPVSSSGHLVIAQAMLPGFAQPGVVFEVLLHAGTMAAVMVYFRRECLQLASAPFRPATESRPDRKLLLLLAAGSVPTAIIGLLLKDHVETLFENLTVTSLMLLITGVLLFVSERFRGEGRREADLNLRDALLVGLVQGAALLPGISRSGSTIAVLLLLGVAGETAARFSFLLALPAVAGATLLSLRELSVLPPGTLPVYLAGAGMAFLVGMVSIHLLLAVVRRKRLVAFALYCWLVGGTFFALSL
jgi:undecaprenyl-diphosphatase